MITKKYVCGGCDTEVLDFKGLMQHVQDTNHNLLNKGVKFDSDKARLDLIPYEALEGLGKVLAYGAKKYDENNWIKGIEFNRLIAAALRHLNQFNSGVDLDAESGLNHIHHALCNLAFLSYMIEHRKDLDNRGFKK